MIFTPLPLPGCFLVAPDLRGDDRGRFARLYCAETFAAQGLETHWPQVNFSANAKAGTLRGLHVQHRPAAEAKLIRCTRGAVFDVLLDLRAGSEGFGRWISVELSAQTPAMVYAAPGCAHGYQTLRDETELTYMHSAPHAPDHEGGVHHADPALGIDWPLPVTALSDRDSALPVLSAARVYA